MNKLMIAAACTLAAQGVASASVEILVDQDYMSSGFFFVGNDFLRGEELNSNRESHRATSPVISGVTGETAYFGFDFNPAAFSGPVQEAVFRVQSTDVGFFGNPSTTNPAEVSLHSLSADPLAAIDQTLASGPGSWIDFRDSEITTSSIVSTTTVDGLGVFDWDITAIVNEWIANGDSNFAYTLGTSVLLDQDPETAVGFINSTWAGLTDEVTARIVIIPAPSTAALLVTAGLLGSRRRR